MTNLSHLKLWDRELVSRKLLEPVEPKYCIVWEDPDDLDAPVKITHPAPRWLAMALAGGYLPPVEAYLMDQETPDGAPKLHPYAEPIGPMTEEEAMEYLVAKDIPRRVWADDGANSRRFAIVPRSTIPTDRSMRNAWRLNDLVRAAA